MRIPGPAGAMLAIVVAATFDVASAHAAGAVHAIDAPVPYVPSGLLERPVPLRTGIGNSHQQVTTTSEKAQAYYDQGLNYLESFVWIEASRSFHEAIRLDSALA